jgi:uncharacterized protein YciI
MEKQYFVIYLNPSRPDFAQTMTDEESNVMHEHVTYWTEYMKQGIMLVFGPVMHPNGVYGLGIVAVDNEDQLKKLIDGDPASKINKYEYYPISALTSQHLVK